MTRIDPQQERQRLTDYYSRQLDGRLEKVAREAYELTDVAREVLRAELKRRSLAVDLTEERPAIAKLQPEPGDPPPPSSPPDDEAESEEALDYRKMVVIRKFRDLPEALLAKGSLDSAGIACVLVDENIVRLDWFLSNLMGGVKLLVAPEDAEEADDVLKQPTPEHLEVPGVGDYEQPHCPKCGSLDINFREIDPSAYVAMFVSLPIPFHRRAWRCHSCNVEWEDDGVADSTRSAS